MRSVTSTRGRPSSASGMASQAGHPPRRVVPDRARPPSSASASAMSSPEVRMALVPHSDSPTDSGHSPVSARWRCQQRVGQRLAGLPRQPARDRLGVDRVEVAAGRQHVDQAAQRRAGRAGRDEAAVQGGDDVRRARRWSGRSRGTTSAHGEVQHSGDVLGVLGPPRGRRPPGPPPGATARPPCARPRARACSSARSAVAPGRRPTRPAPAPPAARAGSACRPRSGGRGGWPAPGRPGPGRPAPAPARAARRGSGTSLISHSQPSTCMTNSSNRSSSGRSDRPRSWSSRAAWSRVQIWARTAGSLAGSRAAMCACSSSSCSSRAMSP